MTKMRFSITVESEDPSDDLWEALKTMEPLTETKNKWDIEWSETMEV